MPAPRFAPCPLHSLHFPGLRSLDRTPTEPTRCSAHSPTTALQALLQTHACPLRSEIRLVRLGHREQSLVRAIQIVLGADRLRHGAQWSAAHCSASLRRRSYSLTL